MIITYDQNDGAIVFLITWQTSNGHEIPANTPINFQIILLLLESSNIPYISSMSL